MSAITLNGHAVIDTIPTPRDLDDLVVGVTVRERINRILNFDLECIVYKFVNPDPGNILMNEAEARQAEILYRQYLILALLYPELSLPPSRFIDDFWHQHQLDNAKFRLDCLWIFGGFFDHFPYFGIRSDDDAANLQMAYAITQNLFASLFGVTELSAPRHPVLAAGCEGGVACGKGTGENVCGGHDFTSLGLTLPDADTYNVLSSLQAAERPRLATGRTDANAMRTIREQLGIF